MARLVAADPAHYVMGRQGHEWVSHRVGRRSSLAHLVAHRVREAFRSQGLVVVALRPTGIVLCGAGAAGLRARSVAVADVIGTVGYLVMVWLAGRVASPDLLEAAVVATRAAVVVITAAALCAGVHRALRHRSARRRTVSRRAHPSAVQPGPGALSPALPCGPAE